MLSVSDSTSKRGEGLGLLHDFERDFVKDQQEAAAHDLWFLQQVQVGMDGSVRTMRVLHIALR